VPNVVLYSSMSISTPPRHSTVHTYVIFENTPQYGAVNHENVFDGRLFLNLLPWPHYVNK